MILIPQRLFDSPSVKTIFRDGNVCILKKSLNEPVENREGYISNHVVSIVLAGEQKITTYEEEEIQVRAGEVVFIPRGLYYITDLLPSDGAFESVLFYFDEALIEQFLSKTKVSQLEREAIPEFLKFGQVPMLQLFVKSLLALYGQGDTADKQILDLKILELLFLLNSQVKAPDFASFLFKLTLPQKRNIKTFMEQNYQKALKVEDYAYLTGRSMSSFRRDFKAYFDMTPQKWLIGKRINQAQSILDQREVNVTDLAEEVGYENVSYFIKEFKAQVGLTPKQYMLSLRKN